MRVLPSRAIQVAVPGTAVVLPSMLLVVHTWRDLPTDVSV
jgi:hypothetical protein